MYNFKDSDLIPEYFSVPVSHREICFKRVESLWFKRIINLSLASLARLVKLNDDPALHCVKTATFKQTRTGV